MLVYAASAWYHFKWDLVALTMSVIMIKTGLPHVREKSGRNEILQMSGNCQGILSKCLKMSVRFAILGMSGKSQGILHYGKNVRELSGNFVIILNYFIKSCKFRGAVL